MHVPLGWLRDAIRRIGYEVTPSPLARLLRHHRPTLLFDVGANVGQFGLTLREAGYTGRVVSFEPMASAFAVLEQTAAADPKWEAIHTALGDRVGRDVIHVASNSASSSLLPPGEGLKEHAAFLAFETSEDVSVNRLDTLYADLVGQDETVSLKVDAQGYELAILNGAEDVLSEIDTVFLEVSLVPLYNGEPPAEVVIGWMRERGFAPAYIAPAYSTRDTRRWIQADILFVRERSA